MRTARSIALSLTLLLAAGLLSALAAVPAAAKGKGVAAPDCRIQLLGGAATSSIGQLRGKVLYVDFWASWCTSCHASFPFMNSLDKELSGKGLQVLAINLDEKLEDAQAFIGKHPVRFAIAVTANASCAKEFGVAGMPTSYIIDRNGIIQHVHQGFRAGEAGALREIIGKLLSGD